MQFGVQINISYELLSGDQPKLRLPATQIVETGGSKYAILF